MPRLRKRPAPLANTFSKPSFTKTLFSPFFKLSPRLRDEPANVQADPNTLTSPSVPTTDDRAAHSKKAWLREVYSATDATSTMFGYRNVNVRAIHVCRSLNAPQDNQEGTEAVADVKDMFLRSQPDITDSSTSTTDIYVDRFVNSKNEPINDDAWVVETASSIVTLIGVLARKGVAMNVLGLLELLCMGSKGQDKAIAEQRKLYLDLVEFELRRMFDVAVLNGSEVW
ncbi:hypothetical protein PMZ80_007134 [Knufia obscura]|uniref:Uncharacterized protein n=1 Tax=Knufia obscura TaxID=1635080 RepID=A0ABR0RK46_9EURO|nr:hypothetical protein PMZ80_007134 [Knufia obscura]